MHKLKLSVIFKEYKENINIISYLSLYYIIKILIIILLIIFVNKTNVYIINLSSKIRGIKYISKCSQNLLINKTLTNNNSLPLISVIIPVFNCENNIEIAIRSIQNQNIDNFEIILINDYSQDNTTFIIKTIQKNDIRIKIINNKKNMGTLYSRSIGVLNSKGKYIFCLDNDDVFCDENLFNSITSRADKYNYDIVEFKTFEIPNYNPYKKEIRESFFNHHENDLFLHQPELGLFPISRDSNYYMNDFHIWGKCIKSKIYKKAVKLLGEKRYKFYNCWTEDISIIFIIFNIAESFIFLDQYGIFHLDRVTSATYKLNDQHKFISELFLLDIIIDFINNIELNQKYIIQKSLLIAETNIINFLNKKNKIYLNSILNKIYNMKFINISEKIKIKNKFNLTYNSEFNY